MLVTAVVFPRVLLRPSFARPQSLLLFSIFSSTMGTRIPSLLDEPEVMSGRGAGRGIAAVVRIDVRRRTGAPPSELCAGGSQIPASRASA